MFGLNRREPLLDEDQIIWIFAIYEWALHHFDADLFYRHTDLITPTNAHFPGRADSVPGMAQLVFDKVRGYAFMAHWPFRLADPGACDLTFGATREWTGPLRTRDVVALSQDPVPQRIPIPYDPRQIDDPEALIASFAHVLAWHLGARAGQAPPGGEVMLPQASEILAVFLGFGLMLGNSAFDFRRSGCGSCRPAPVGRQNTLSQYHAVYALAIFAVLKDIPFAQIKPHLKKSLRTFYRKSVRDVQGRSDQLQLLRLFEDPEQSPSISVK